MIDLIYRIVFLLITILIVFNSISYAFYEMKNEKNKYGGICVIIFTIFSSIFSNIMVWQR